MPKIILVDGTVIETEQQKPSKARVYYRLKGDGILLSLWGRSLTYYHWVAKEKVAFFTSDT